jgi:hypothetical protein
MASTANTTQHSIPAFPENNDQHSITPHCQRVRRTAQQRVLQALAKARSTKKDNSMPALKMVERPAEARKTTEKTSRHKTNVISIINICRRHSAQRTAYCAITAALLSLKARRYLR